MLAVPLAVDAQSKTAQSPARGLTAHAPAVVPASVENAANPSCVTGQCHSQMGQDRYVHGPVAVKACAVCHTTKPGTAHPTKARQSESDFDFAAQGSALCYACHERKDTFGATRWLDLCRNCHRRILGE